VRLDPFQLWLENITIDLLYLYFFPFILLDYLSKICFRLFKAVALWNEPKSEITGELQVISAPQERSVSDRSPRFSLRVIIDAVLKPLRQFTLLWCLLLLLSSHRFLSLHRARNSALPLRPSSLWDRNVRRRLCGLVGNH
jgi:hypothetical protein